MAAAVTLADAGLNPTVLEAADMLGGRARRIEWNGHTLDNGQHMLLGAYRQTLALHARVGGTPASFHRIPFALQVDDFRLKSVALPAPLHVGAGLLASRGLGWRDRWHVLRFTAAVLHGPLPADEETAAAMFARKRQPPRVVSVLWGPLCLAALNTPPAEASARLFAHVLRAALASRSDSDFIVPREDLSAFLPERGAAYVRARGGNVLTGTRVRQVSAHHDHIDIQCDTERRFDYLICATAPHQAERLLSSAEGLDETVAALRALRSQSIITVYLKFASPLNLGAPIFGATEGFDWAFDRAWSHGSDALFAAVLSGANDRARTPHSTIVEAVLESLTKRATLPRLAWTKMIRERHATIAATAGLKRPRGTTGLPRLFLAGDYVESPYPATIESAVGSGIEAAQRVIAALRRERHAKMPPF